MITLNKQYVAEISELIKNLLTFCKYKVQVSSNEISLLCSKNDLKKIILFLKDNPSFNLDTLIDITAIDFPSESKRFTVVYNLLSVTKNFRLKIKIKISENESVQSICDVFCCANWYEREIWDLFGIRFSEHPDLRRILTDYDFEGHPLRKDFPLTGFTQVRYDEELNKVIKEPVKLDQAYRNFDNLSPWEGMSEYLPGDEKAKAKND